MTDAKGDLRDLAVAPAPVPAEASQGYGEMARQHSARRSGASQSERTTANEGFAPAVVAPTIKGSRGHDRYSFRA